MKAVALLVLVSFAFTLGACGANAGDRYLNDNDGELGEGHLYHDKDDSGLLRYGNAASPGESQAITSLVRRYYAAVAAADGQNACAMLSPWLAKMVPATYSEGQPGNGSSETCALVVARLFTSLHAKLSVPITVTAVRVKGTQAHVLLGSTALRPSYIIVQHEDGSWRIAQLLGSENTLA